ncbi:MAG: HDIG domain-containing protein [Clostridium sp.]|nr:HDIG domain-containing protein [Clostridium sp.]
MKNKLLFNTILSLIATAIIVYFFPHPESTHYKYEQGRPWNYAKLIAPFDIPIRPDTATMKAVRDSLDRIFVPVFTPQPDASKEVVTELLAKWSHQDAAMEPSENLKRMRQRAVALLQNAYKGYVIDDSYAARVSDGSLAQVRLQKDNIVGKKLGGPITTPSLLSRYIASVIDDDGSIDADSVSAEKWIESEKLEEVIKPNIAYNRSTSERLYADELNQLNVRMGAVISGVIQQGQTIIDKGNVISSQDFTNLQTYERMIDEKVSGGSRSMLLMWFGQFLYVAIAIASLMTFFRFTEPKIWESRQAMAFVLIMITLFFLVGVGLDRYFDSGIYLVPFAIVPVLMIVFFDAPSAIFTSLVLVVLCAGVVSFPLEFIFLQLAASIAATYSLTELAKRSQLLRTSIYVFLAYICGYVAIELMLNGNASGFQWRMVISLGVSAALASMAYILMVAVERSFGFVSIVTLIELTDTNNPILRELSQQCPGTFQHSMAVSNLATDAALKIDANEQLVRAGALYHDIGKINNPNFFTENQRGVNPHDALPPERSAEIIIGHVKDGLERADKEGLPSVIKDFIAQHHGKGKAKYFFFTYCKLHAGEEIDEKLFTYPGPNPKTREASLLMMADSVEAASRSLSEHTPEAISGLVNRIIDGQIADGLHNDSPLLFRDIAIIKAAFVKRLMTMYHSRIVYPEDPNKKSKSE